MIRKFRVWGWQNEEWRREEGWRYHFNDYLLKPNGEILEHERYFDPSYGFIDDLYEPSNPPIVEFYTGLEDMNEREIYEGDIIVHHYPRSSKLKPEAVIFDPDHGYNITRYTIEKNASYIIPVEVIGNIHENPELLL